MCLKDHLCHEPLYIACLSAALLQLVILMFVFPFGVWVCVVPEDAENYIECFGSWPGKCLGAVSSQNSLGCLGKLLTLPEEV